MTAEELIEFLKDVNPVAPIYLDYCGFVFEVTSVEVQNGRVHIQGY